MGLCLWLYGLATGKGVTARIFGYKFTRSNPELLTAMPWWQFLIFIPVATGFSYIIAVYVNEHITKWYEKVFNYVYCCCPCCCSGVGCNDNSIEEIKDTLVTIHECINDLTGADADATTPLSMIGLDSFGAGALVGVVVGKIPGVRLRA